METFYSTLNKQGSKQLDYVTSIYDSNTIRVENLMEVTFLNIRYETNSDIQYIQYLNEHRDNTYKAFLSIRDILLTNANEAINISDMDQQLRNHDLSKQSDEEWAPYRNYFYPTSSNPKDDAAFDRAWLHHQYHNPHHWQHWVLLRDSGELEPLDMPENYVIEMCCDWHSFSAKNPKSTAYQWYQDNKSKMKLSDNTTALVEKYIEYFKESLNSGGNEK